MNKLNIILIAFLSTICIAADEPEFTFLTPSSVAELSAENVKSLEAENCLIPKWKFKFGGVAMGEFAAKGQMDTAVICHHQGRSEIWLFWGGPVECDSRIESIGQFISTVDKKFILDHYGYYGGPKPPEITHQAINDHFVEKASVVKYCKDGKWIDLTGAD